MKFVPSVMSRLRALTCLIAIIGAQIAHGQTAAQSGGPEWEISYAYRLTTNKSEQLCEHMSSVFNASFRRLWVQEPIPLADTESPYAADGKFAFPRVRGVQHDQMKTFDMALSKLPSSQEFAAIRWQETRVTTGAPAGAQVPESSTPLAALNAYFDFDNDGRKDTVLKYGFTRGYAAIRQRGESSEYLTVLPGEAREIAPNESLWELSHVPVGNARAITENGQYLRPFIYAGRAYVAKYEMHSNKSETLSIVEFQDRGARNEFTQAPVWTGTRMCEYQMTQLDAQPVAADPRESQLPQRLLGTWTADGGFAPLGELRLTAEKLSWGDCAYEEYRVSAQQDHAYQIEVLSTPPCRLGMAASYLIFDFSERAREDPGEAVEVWICKGKDAFDQPAARQFCAWGILRKKPPVESAQER